MAEILLRTKLSVPPLRAAMVPRPHLVERLNQGRRLGHKLTLISAPAGFGKTTLICEWLGNLQPDLDGETPIINQRAWLSMDESDNDPTRFLAYFIGALKEIEGVETTFGDTALSLLRSTQPPPINVILASLINEVADIPYKIIFVLDDYHCIEASSVDDALVFLLENLPPQFHLVIATRDDPNLQISRLRGRGQLTELRALDLRFSTSEAGGFLKHVMGLDLSVDDISALAIRTEGWVAGLQLAAISMQGHKDATSFVKSFTGSHRFVLDYLIEEVLEQQTESVQTFLLKSCVLNRMTGSLCDALSGQNNGQATLEQLERANLFLIPLDNERHWYRYHHLFADLLRRRLHQMQPDWVQMLHQRASEWFEQNGFIDEAIEHALRVEDFERATHLLEKHIDAIWQRGEQVRLRRWQAALPAELLYSKPRLCILHAWYLFIGGQLDMAEEKLQTAERVLDHNSVQATEISPPEQNLYPGTDRINLQGRIAAIRAFIASYRGDVLKTIQYAEEAQDHLPEQDLKWRSIVAISLGDAYDVKDDTAAAYKARVEALKTSRAAGDMYLFMIANLKVAVTLRVQGQLQQIIEICRQQWQIVHESGLSHIVVVGWLLAIWGEALAELNDLDEALKRVKRSVELTEQSGDVAMLGWSYLCLIRVLFSRGDMTGAEDIIYKMEHIVREHSVPPWMMNIMAAWQGRLWLAQDKLETASQWEEERGLNVSADLSMAREMEYIVLARIMIAQERLEEADRLLQRLFKAAEAGGRTARMIEILMLQALAFQAGGDIAQAVSTLEQAITLAEPLGFVRIFVDEGPSMARLLHEVLSRGVAPDYIRQLLGVFSHAELEQKTTLTKSKVGQSVLVEPLSEREIEVLKLIAEGLPNQEISSRLYVSLNTVKTHIRSIYTKLDAHTRTQAVARGRALGLLHSD